MSAYPSSASLSTERFSEPHVETSISPSRTTKGKGNVGDLKFLRPALGNQIEILQGLDDRPESRRFGVGSPEQFVARVDVTIQQDIEDDIRVALVAAVTAIRRRHGIDGFVEHAAEELLRLTVVGGAGNPGGNGVDSLGREADAALVGGLENGRFDELRLDRIKARGFGGSVPQQNGHERGGNIVASQDDAELGHRTNKVVDCLVVDAVAGRLFVLARRGSLSRSRRNTGFDFGAGSHFGFPSHDG